MNIVVVGLGSMGKRRMRLIRALYPEYALFGVDAREDRRADQTLSRKEEDTGGKDKREPGDPF